jgi:hypothetical protein
MVEREETTLVKAENGRDVSKKSFFAYARIFLPMRELSHYYFVREGDHLPSDLNNK